MTAAVAWTEVLEEPTAPTSVRELGVDGAEPERRCSARRSSDKPGRCGRVAKHFDELGLPVCGLHRPRRSS